MLNGGYVASTRVREGCYMLGAKRLDYDAGGASTLAQVKQMAAYCLGDEDQIVNNNAYFPFENFFMDGLMAQALIEYWEDPKTGNGDPRIPPAIKAIADHVWSVGWIPWSGGNGEFVYNLFQNQIGLGVGQMESLNLLIAPMFAWLYENTGLSEYQLEGDTIWSAGVNDPPSDGIGWSGKNFSQQYRWSFDYVTWRTLH
jgi:hypothetical protein